jgi:hypothetical protein
MPHGGVPRVKTLSVIFITTTDCQDCLRLRKFPELSGVWMSR